jgi:hypothetical protein
MDNISDILISFSDKHDLWNLTEKSALECINNYVQEEKINNTNELDGLTVDNFVLKKKKQELVFWFYENKTFILRTTYTLYTDKQENQILPYGEYSLDIDSEGKPVDDWLIFD